MNEDDFEKKLRTLTGMLKQPDPTPAWKEEILARARRERRGIPITKTLPPRWLAASWAAAWIAILVLNFTLPKHETSSATGGIESRSPAADPDVTASPKTLLALEQRMNLNLELP